MTASKISVDNSLWTDLNKLCPKGKKAMLAEIRKDGWVATLTCKTKEDLIAEIRRRHVRIKEYAVTWPDGMWVLMQDSKGGLHIRLFVLEAHCWCYLSVSEGDGLGYYRCPQRFLDRTPVIDQAWRDKVQVARLEKHRFARYLFEYASEADFLDEL